MKRFAKTLLVLALMCVSMTAVAQKDPDVGNAPMSPKKTIVENAMNSPIHKRLVDAIKAAGLVDTLNGKGPFTIFAPTDDAFNKLPAGTLNNLLKPENKAMLTKVLTYHVVPGKIDADKLKKMIKKSGGTATLTTLEGDKLTVKNSGDVITLSDEKDGSAVIITADIKDKNGITHVIDGVLMPN